MRSRTRRTAAMTLFVLVILGWVWFLRPPALGGTTTFIVVRGSSMEPTMRDGDLVIARRQQEYAIGEVVAYRRSSDGRTMIHRIVSRSAGTYTLRGDNNRVNDPWTPSGSDILGTERLHVPGLAGVLEAAMRFLMRPIGMAITIALATFLLVIGGDERRAGSKDEEDVLEYARPR